MRPRTDTAWARGGRPSLRGGKLYGEQPIWEGLGVLDYAIVPHVDSREHPESAACGLVAEEYRRLGLPHKTLRDGEVLVMDGSAELVCR